MAPFGGSDVVERILRALSAEVPAILLPAFRFCLEHSHEPLSVEQIAQACGIKRRALEYRFRKAGLRPPGTCLIRCRLLLVVHDLEQRTESIERVALGQAFGTAGALRKSLARRLGAAPSSFRRAGAFDAAMAAFLQEIRRGSPPSH